MKHIFLLTLIITSQLLLAQSREPVLNEVFIDNETSLLLKLGVGFPSSDFGDTDLDNEKSGIAVPGFLFESSLNHFISESVYLSFMGRLQSNGLSEDEFVTFYRGLVPANVSITFESDAWRVNSLMVGLGTQNFLDNKTNFITRFMLGFSGSHSPSFKAVLSDGSTTVTESQESQSGTAFSYLIGAGINIQTNSSFSISIGADYFATAPEFSNVRFTGTVNNVVVANEAFSFKQEINLINLSIGLSIPL